VKNIFSKNRKVKIYLVNLVVALVCAFILRDAVIFQMFLNFLLYLSLGFFASNAASKFGGKNNGEQGGN